MKGAPSSSPVSKIVTMCGVVAEAAHRLRLAADADDAVGVEAVGLDQREGDVAVELGVVREVDALLGALAEEGADGVAAAGERRGQRRRGGRGPGARSWTRVARQRMRRIRGRTSWRADSSAPQLAQALSTRSAPPHSPQNLTASGFWWLQAGHCTCYSPLSAGL